MMELVLDVGSGACKGCLLHRCSNGTVRVLYEREATCLLGHAVAEDLDARGKGLDAEGRRSLKKHIPPRAAASLVATLQTILKEAASAAESSLSDASQHRQPFRTAEEKGLSIYGVCTAVFREAENGPDVLRIAMEAIQGARIVVATQALEGLLGYMTAVALLQQRVRPPKVEGLLPAPLVVWDSGGASFQLSTSRTAAPIQQQLPSDPSAEALRALSESLVVYEGRWGSSKAVHAVARIIQQNRDGDPKPGFHIPSTNPMSRAQVDAAVSYFMADLDTARSGALPSGIEKEQFLRQRLAGVASSESRASVVGIGGPTCAFRMCALLLKRTTQLRCSDLYEALLDQVVGKSDAELQPHFPQADMVGPKVCLVMAVQKYFQFSDVGFEYCASTGTSLGIAACRSLLTEQKSQL